MPIPFQEQLNPAQWEAVRTLDGPVLVIAGAGSGKTRTIVYRLAHLLEQGVAPESILLLTFTRKAAQEMLERAAHLLGYAGFGPSGSGGGNGGLGAGVHRVAGGTFHSFAHRTMRRFPPPGFANDFTIMDRADAESLFKDIKGELGLGKGDRSYPKSRTVFETMSKARNKELTISDVLSRDAFHLTAYANDMERMAEEYEKRKLAHGLMDYDDLLFRFESQLRADPELLARLQGQFSHVMVDEYQDTNLVQARLVRLICGAMDANGDTGHAGNIMAVGDDAQSIYAFRGANVSNILDFPSLFPGARVIKLEQNYRSTQPILKLTNEILADSPTHYQKELFSDREDTNLPQLIRPLSDLTQAKLVVDTVIKLLKKYDAKDVAVLIRAGYQSYHVETQLSKLGIRFRKFGGIRFTDAAHIKDVLAFLRLAVNPADLPAWHRAVGLCKGVGPKTATKLYDALMSGQDKYLATWRKKKPELDGLLQLLDKLRAEAPAPRTALEQAAEHYHPFLEALFPDDHPKRWTGIEELVQISSSYLTLPEFLADLCLESPETGMEEEQDEAITLSTIHSAKGLEWRAVLILDLVEERFPSRHALNSAEDFEEERRLMYVACTRARDYLALFVPATLYRRGQESSEPAVPSPFVRDLSPARYDELRESYTGLRAAPSYPANGYGSGYSGGHGSSSQAASDSDTPAPPRVNPAKLGFCKHKIFGRGKIIQVIGTDKYKVNFPGFGLKVILADYLELE